MLETVGKILLLIAALLAISASVTLMVFATAHAVEAFLDFIRSPSVTRFAELVGAIVMMALTAFAFLASVSGAAAILSDLTE
jgi:H2-forming N5,N10-methylenetetrahydromethanopterin dehydrogenase-like enzyme